MRQCIFITALCVCTSLIATAHAAGLRTVALTGQQAPGAASGVTYESFGSFHHPQSEFLYRGPVLNDAGQTAFRANLTGGGVDSTNNQGVWSEGSGSMSLVTRTGSQAPGAPAGVNFGLDPALELFSPVLNNAGRTAFHGGLTDGGLGLWSEGSGSLALVARSGQQAPGTPDGTNFNFGFLYDYLLDPVLNDAGQTAFLSYLTGTGVVDGLNHHGLWSGDSGNLTLVARTGSQAPGALPGVLYGFQGVPGLNDAGQTAFFSYLRTGSGGVNTSNNQSIWSEGSGTLTMIARTASQAPGLPSGVNFSALYSTAAINSAGQTAFVAGLSDENSTFQQDSVWSDASGSLTIVARRGTQAPGMPAGAMYDFFGHWLALNDAGQTAFLAGLIGDGVDSTYNEGIWLVDSGTVTLVAARGNHAPGTPDGVTFRNIKNLVTLNNAGQTAFRADLTGSGVDSTNDLGIWAADQTGALQLLARTGDELEVAPDDFRTISQLEFVGGTGNSNGWSTGFNNLGQLVFWASFTDGSEGVFVSNAVAHLPGDFNNDGTVDAADYVAWRKGLGTTYDENDYGVWRANFGASLGPGSGSAGYPLGASAEPLSAAAPEPATVVLLATWAAGLGLLIARRGRRIRNS